ncbi:hypothetical protein AJ80_08894 [Polytolypa hystricis UAMH7299]|uniref:DUF7924 domain-containing protein n=1 Tax=Polytolypa hystricis (strain UAMH7299) TaxID=1447883 RepID=A0A2B7X060_POLH7|nr:hypothetical protein AJ80_08894 [Polytolypa hystricis UAMH7299]
MHKNLGYQRSKELHDTLDPSHYGNRNLTECANEGWDSSVSLDKAQPSPQPLLQALQHQPSRQFRLSQPQPDYAVGFARQAFTEGHLKKLAQFIGKVGETSFFINTAFMYFYNSRSEVWKGRT